MNSILLFLAGLTALALSALFAVPYFVDWNDYRDVFEAQASKLIGRTVDVGGDVSLTVLPVPVLRFETINVADAKRGFDTPFAAAKSFTVWLSVPPLLRGTIEASSVEIDQPVVNLRIAKDGSGNWADIGGETAALPFIPKEVALNSVKINGATINIWRGNPEPESVLEQLGGELSARSLQGPYKFKGHFALAKARRELLFSTARREENGQFRLKASVRSPEVRETYTIDGAVRGLGTVPVFKGEFRARLAERAPPEDTAADEKKSETAAPIEIKSELFARLTGAQFNNAELTITKNNKPQTVRGVLDVKFKQGLVLAGTFSSRWIDIDSWFGSGGDAPSKLNAALSGLANESLRRASAVRGGSLKFLFDQAVVGGDLATNVRLGLAVADGSFEITDLSATLPGDNTLRLGGVLSGEGRAAAFKGQVSVDGRSLSRLLRWAGVANEPSAATQSGDFSLKGILSAGPDRISLEESEGSLFGSAFSGAFAYKRGSDEDEVSVKLKSDRMDLARVLGASASARSLWRLLTASGQEKDSNDNEVPMPISGLGKMRAMADVNIGAVSFAGLGESALDAKLTLTKGALDIRRLSLMAGSDVSLQAGGRLTGLGDKPQGNLTLAVQADTGKGLVSLSEFLDMPDLVKNSPDRLAALAPVQVTAAIRSASPDSAGLDVQLEGSLGRSELLLKLDLVGTPAKWPSSRIALQGSMTNGSGVELLRQVLPHLKQGDLAAFGAGAGTMSLEARGVPREGLQTKMILNAGSTNWTTQGSYRVADDGNSFSGATSLGADNTAAGLLLFGVRVAPGHGSEPARLAADVAADSGVYRLQNLKGELGGASFSGNAEIDLAKERRSVAAQITASAASLPRLLAPMVAWQTNGQNPQEIRGVSNVEGYWPDVPFDTEFVAKTDASLSLDAERLQLSGGVLLERAKIRAKLKDGTLKIAALEGELFGGKFEANGELTSRGGGMALDAKVEAKGVRLERLALTSARVALVNAPADLTISLSGEGLTPRGLASSLGGTGQLELGAGKITGFSLGAAHAAASFAQREKKQGGVDEAELGRRVAENLKRSEMAFSPIRAPFTVGNGVLEFDKIALSDADGRVTIASFLQLSTLELDSEWALQSAETTTGPKPRVSLVFSGALKDIGKIQPRIDTTGLARYVTMRKMEKDVERLEKLDVSGAKPSEKPQQPGAETTAQAPPEPATPDTAPRPKRKQPAAAAAAAASQPAPPLPERKQKPAAAQAATVPPAASAPPATEPPPAAVPPPATEPPPASEPPPAAVQPPAPPVPAVIPQPARKPPPASVAAAPQAATTLPPIAPLPVRKPPVPKPPPAAAAPAQTPPQAARQPAPQVPRPPPRQPATPPPAAPPDLPWLQSTTPPPAAPTPPGTAQGPIQLPAPAATAGQSGAPPPGQTPATADQPGAPPPGQTPGTAPPARDRESPFTFPESGN